MSKPTIADLKEQFIVALNEDLKDPEQRARIYDTVRAFLKDFKDEADAIPNVKLTSPEDDLGKPPFQIGAG